MARLVWDNTGEHLYETGVKNVVVYPQATGGTYPKGAAWNGVTSIAENPSGAEASPMYADDIKYLNLLSAEEFGATVEAYTYPDEFADCDGSKELAKGVRIGQQKRKAFGLCYRTVLGNDVDGNSHGYKLHIIYGALAAPTDKEYNSLNNDPNAATFSWTLSTTPVSIAGFDPTASIEIDSTTVDAKKLSALEDILYGKDTAEARLPLPDEIATMMKAA